MARIIGSPDGAPAPAPAPANALSEPLGRLVDPEVLQILERQPKRDVQRARQIFVNRNLRMDKVAVVGFDMDYTLAIYHKRRIEQLSYDMTLVKLVRERGYPQEVGRIVYDPAFVMRGLVVDREAGNLFKMDRFAHVGRAYHGRRPLSEAERWKLYREEKVKLSTERYAWIDTLFALPEACLYSEIIDLLEAAGGRVDYGKLYDDIRECIDTVHRDGSLKAEIRKDIGEFIYRDPELGPTLHKLRSAGKRLFLLTNSMWDYTDSVMKHLLEGCLPEYPSWRNYFDVVIVGASKPTWFTEDHPFFEIDSSAGTPGTVPATSLARGHIYQGGNLHEFEKHFGESGERVLYVGDHIYGDILKSKKSSLWRTCMIIQELEEEIDYTDSHVHEVQRLADLEVVRDRLGDEVNQLKLALNGIERRLERGANGEEPALEEDRRAAKLALDRLRRALRETTLEADELESQVESSHNPYWGLLFKEGNENSRFGEQVEQYACLYTSRVSNLLSYSPMQYYRSPRDAMPHERTGILSGRLSPWGGDGPPRGAGAG